MRRRLNFRVAAAAVVFLAVAAAVVHGLHRYQITRQTSNLLEEAARAEHQGELAEAASYLEHYLTMAPDEPEALSRYGLLLERSAHSGGDHKRAFFALEKALRAQPERHDVRRALVPLAIRLGRHTDARDHLNILLAAFPEDSDLQELQARCAAATAQFAEAADWYERALRHDPQRVDSYVERARLLRRRLNRAADADRVMDQLVEANPRSLPARLARAHYLGEYHGADRAAAELAFARELAPDDLEVLIASAEAAMAQRRFDEARDHLRRGMETHPTDARLCQGMARLELQAGRHGEAAAHLRRAAADPAGSPLALFATADLLIDARQYAEAKELIDRLVKQKVLPALVDYLNGRLRLVEEDWAEARRLLERAQQGLTAFPELRKQANLLLAVCYQHLSNPDLQLAAYQAALEIDPAWLPARLGRAATTAALGRTDEAARMYAQLAGLAPAARLRGVRMLALRNLRLPAGQRNWTEAERLLDDAPETLRHSLDWRLARVELFFAEGEVGKAQAYLQAVRREFPQSVELAVAGARLAVACKQPKQALAILDQAEKELGDGVELRLTRAAVQAATDKNAQDLLRSLAERTDGFVPVDKGRLFAGLAPLALRAGAVRVAAELAERCVELQPSNVDMLALRLQVALQEQDKPACDKWLTRLKAAEGEDGVLWRYVESLRQVRTVTASDRSASAGARERLAEAHRLRPHWPQLPLLEAELCEREGNFDGAIDKYRQAVALGHREPNAIRRVVVLLYERHRYIEAQDMLRHLREETPLAGDLGRLAAEVSFSSHQAPEQTLELARKAVPADTTDPRELLWLGQVLTALNQSAEAEKTLRRAAAQAGDMPEVWVSLVSLLARTGQKEAAEKAIAEAQQKLPEKQASLALAVCWESLDRHDNAKEYFKAALAAQPNDANVLRAVATYHLRAGQPVQALPSLRKLVAAGPENGKPWARRTLALTLASTGDYRQFREAVGLVEENLKQPGAGAEDQRARALVLAAQPSRRRDSIRALEESFARLPASADERFLLARLYDADQNWAKARGELLGLVSIDRPNALHLAYYIDALLRRQELREASHWLRKLEKLEADSWQITQLRARLLVAQGKAAEAVRLLKAYRGAEAGLPVAALLEALDQKSAAEEMYRQLNAGSDQPEYRLALASYLGRSGKVGEALELCDQAAAKSSKPEAVAAVRVAILRAGQPTPAQVEQVAKRLTAALDKEPKSSVLRLLLADLRDFQGRFAEALALYQRVLEAEPNNPVANNNMAMLVTLHQRQASKALELSQRAIEHAGPAPALLDTRALAYLAAGQHEQAVSDLEEAVHLEPSGTRYYHLAQAYRAAKNGPAAGLALRKAKSLGLNAQTVHPLERADFEKFAAEP
jgi:tetratricopeptide (TPR) repeat protein